MEKKNTINLEIAEEIIGNSSEVVYQYYQKFGFTDLCEDIIQVNRTNNLPKLSKSLPMTKKDLKLFREVSKVFLKKDDEQLKPRTTIRNINKDIELKFSEYYPDPTLVIKMKIGEYEIEESGLNKTIRIYDEESGLYYVEIHRCDGT